MVVVMTWLMQEEGPLVTGRSIVFLNLAPLPGHSPGLSSPGKDPSQGRQGWGRLTAPLKSVDEDPGHQWPLQSWRGGTGPTVEIEGGPWIQVGD